MLRALLLALPLTAYWVLSAVLSFTFMFTTYCPFLLPGLFLTDLSLELMVFPLPLFLAFFVFREKHDLPTWLAWFGQWDDNLRAVREGTNWTDKWYVRVLRNLEYKSTVPVIKKFLHVFATWAEAVLWIIRNPGQYFDYWICGQTIKPVWSDNLNDGFRLTVYGNTLVGDQPIIQGWKLMVLHTGDRVIPNLRIIGKLPFFNIYFHAWLGWQYPSTVEEIKGQTKAQVKATLGFIFPK